MIPHHSSRMRSIYFFTTPRVNIGASDLIRIVRVCSVSPIMSTSSGRIRPSSIMWVIAAYVTFNFLAASVLVNNVYLSGSPSTYHHHTAVNLKLYKYFDSEHQNRIARYYTFEISSLNFLISSTASFSLLTLPQSISSGSMIFTISYVICLQLYESLWRWERGKR